MAQLKTAPSYVFWTTLVFLAGVFLLGGGARADIQSLVILRPLVVVCMGIALWSLTREKLAAARVPLLIIMIVPMLIILQLIPLPPSIWTNLPGREFVAQQAALAGIEQPWRPISLVPYRTWNSLLAWLVPITGVLLMANISREERFILLPALIACGVISGIVGLVQVLGSANGPLYLYDITNNGSAVGLFANRNHQAALLACLFPMLAVYASLDRQVDDRSRMKSILCAVLTLFVIPLLLVTGSRAGIVLGFIGLSSAALLYRRPSQRRRPETVPRQAPALRYAVVGIAIVLLAGTTALLSRAKAFERLTALDETEGLRIKLLEPMWQMIRAYFPVGTGFGTFPEIYKVHEPFGLLTLSYVNHAHNDLLEFVLEGGLFSVVVLLYAGTAGVIGIARLRLSGVQGGRTMLFGRLGATILIILGVASVVDYPLRVPSISAVCAIALAWMTFAAAGSRECDVEG